MNFTIILNFISQKTICRTASPLLKSLLKQGSEVILDNVNDYDTDLSLYFKDGNWLHPL